MTFLELLRLARRVFQIGAPPEISDEPRLRVWVANVLDLLAELARSTATDVDDALVGKLVALTVHDRHWSLLYAILRAAAEYFVAHPDAVLLGDSLPSDVATLADESAIDPSIIASLIQLLLKLIEFWRRR